MINKNLKKEMKNHKEVEYEMKEIRAIITLVIFDSQYNLLILSEYFYSVVYNICVLSM